MSNHTGYCGVFKYKTIYSQFSDNPKSLTIAHTVFCVISCIAMAATVILNATFLAVMTFHKRSQTTGTKLFMMLSALDLTQGVTLWPGAVTMSYLFSRHKFNCLLIDLLAVFGYSVGLMVITGLFTIALDQYIAIQYPYFYHNSVTISRLLVPLTLAWLPILSSTLLVKFVLPRAWNPLKTILATIAFILLLTMFYFYLRVWCIVRVVNNRINSIDKKEGARIKRRAKAAKTAWIVLLTCLFCYTPMFISNVYEVIQLMPPFVQMHIEPIAELVAATNSIWDPLVYYLRMKKIRRMTKATLRTISGSEQNRRSNDIEMSDFSC